MNATDALMNDHRVIEQVLSCLETMAAQAEATGVLDVESAAQALDFFRVFADRHHHGKEEGHLFPLLEARGLVRHGGPTGVMLHEHELGRALLADLAAAIERQSAADFLSPAREYVQLLRDHIWKEDQRLFRFADQLLGEEEDRQLMQAFEAAEQAPLGEGTRTSYLQLASQLADRFGVQRGQTPHSCGGGCSGHGLPGKNG